MLTLLHTDKCSSHLSSKKLFYVAETHNWSKYRLPVIVVPRPYWYIYNATPIPMVGEHLRRQSRKIIDPETQDTCCEKVFYVWQ